MDVDHVGVYSGSLANISILKRYAIFFNKIYVYPPDSEPDYEEWTPDYRKWLSKISSYEFKLHDEEKIDYLRHELNYLRDIGFITKPVINLIDPADLVKRINDLPEELNDTAATEILTAWNQFSVSREKGDYDKIDLLSSQLRARIESILLRHEGTDAVCVSSNNIFKRNVDQKLNLANLYEIIIDDIPLPDETVPWSDLISFQSDPNSQQQLRALRRWMANTVKSDFSFAEAVDEIEYLKEEYHSSMRRAGISTVSGALKTVVVAAAEIVEDTIKLKLKDLAEAPFKLFDTRKELLKAESEAPGRELAYIVRASDTFKAREI